MNFSHYNDRPAQLAVDLVNSDELNGDEISDLPELAAFLDRYRDLRPPLRPAPDLSDLTALHALRDRLREVFESSDETAATDRINQILSENPAIPRLSMHDGQPHLHFEPIGTSLSSWVAAITALGLAGVMAEHGISRFGSCQASNCRDVFIDTTRNRSRIHCCSNCSTREAVAAYRKRQAAHD
ncbi:MAG TPA: ABATE domain-containing protein [Acidimicrobiia bacterium]|nr:ABATE domain-containing protein [Acidimicrobiia bacterium]